jgi:hypothetical protein
MLKEDVVCGQDRLAIFGRKTFLRPEGSRFLRCDRAGAITEAADRSAVAPERCFFQDLGVPRTSRADCSSRRFARREVGHVGIVARRRKYAAPCRLDVEAMRGVTEGLTFEGSTTLSEAEMAHFAVTGGLLSRGQHRVGLDASCSDEGLLSRGPTTQLARDRLGESFDGGFTFEGATTAR